MRAASCSTRTVSSAAEPRRDQLRPAGEPGEEVRLDEPGGDPDVASLHSRFSQPGTSRPNVARHTIVSDARESWLTMRTDSTTSSPNIARSSSGVFARWVPVATRTTTSRHRLSCPVDTGTSGTSSAGRPPSGWTDDLSAGRKTERTGRRTPDRPAAHRHGPAPRAAGVPPRAAPPPQTHLGRPGPQHLASFPQLTAGPGHSLDHPPPHHAGAPTHFRSSQAEDVATSSGRSS